MKTDWSDVAFWVFAALMFLAFCGEPDLMDAIIHCLTK